MSGSITRTTAQRIVSSQNTVKPLLSANKEEAKRRVIQLYRAWNRQLPLIYHDFDLDVGIPTMRKKLREEFDKNKDVTDVRVIDMLVIKGHQELEETHYKFKQKCHVMTYFKETVNKKPKDFLGKFYDGKE